MANLNYTVAQINAILAKALAMTVPTLLSQLTNDEGYIKSADIPTKTSDLVNDSGFITNAATQAILDEFVNYYTKSQTYSKSEVNSLINALEQFEVVIANSLPVASASTLRKMYLVPSDNPKTSNVKDEYVTIQSGGSYSWEQIGSTAIDLSAYSTTTQVQAMINSALTPYSTTTQVQNMINTAKADYSTTAQVQSMIGSAVANAVFKGTVIESNVSIAD